jgi:hypothetical protein
MVTLVPEGIPFSKKVVKRVARFLISFYQIWRQQEQLLKLLKRMVLMLVGTILTTIGTTYANGII